MIEKWISIRLNAIVAMRLGGLFAITAITAMTAMMTLTTTTALYAAPPGVPGSAGGIQDPLQLKQVKLVFGFGDFGQPRATVTGDEKLKGFGATFFYRGAGTVIGRWEVVLPGEPLPSAYHLMPEYQIPVGEKSQLAKYSVIDTFFESFMPTGRHYLAGPNPQKLPRSQPGVYQILLRIESISAATANNPSQGNFVLPYLQYTVTGAAASAAASTK